MMTELNAGRLALLQAATRRFPEHAQAIEQLAERDETFRDICQELADAETALESVRRGPTELREAREDEWQALIERLAAQITEALQNENVIPIRRRSSPRPR
jgi:chromosome segregation ATPase